MIQNTPKRQEDVWQVSARKTQGAWLCCMTKSFAERTTSCFCTRYRLTTYFHVSWHCIVQLRVYAHIDSVARATAGSFLHGWYLRWITGVLVPPSVTSGVHRTPNRDRYVTRCTRVFCILAFSLVFHAVTPERSSFRQNPTCFSTFIRR